MENKIGLQPAYAGNMVKELNDYLGNVQVAYMNVRGYHWNVVGKQFFSLHEKFEEIYNNLNEMADEIAERVLMLGGKPVHAFSAYLKTATIKEKTNVSKPEDTVREVIDDIRKLLEQERRILEMAADNGDEGTASMLSEYISGQEKLIWMLNATLN
jgi:starvation-inducible DNA-binding protein